ncbi:SH3 domain-containing protein [Actinacidiphila sp. ITFR-21]|uniref:SH3 domain-containing protein n=1 Tax=Actinacidiphila sp. ITFR-21 TaxID=3075199 RepID=UPI00288B810E|nr:SH3 domain-containing protein [Streptomyces sp. ITFR-21]WNI19941.1 SH3 domain-containing protein [Streptomyces sp. ITFR-21]
MSMKIRLATLAVAAGVALGGAVGLGAETASAAPQLAVPAYVPWISGTATPAVQGLRIRSGPGTGYITRGLLYRGDRMKVTQQVTRGSAGSWFYVTLTRRSASGLRSGFSGWVYASYLRKA